jgi:hypothetical protein
MHVDPEVLLFYQYFIVQYTEGAKKKHSRPNHRRSSVRFHNGACSAETGVSHFISQARYEQHTAVNRGVAYGEHFHGVWIVF